MADETKKKQQENGSQKNDKSQEFDSDMEEEGQEEEEEEENISLLNSDEFDSHFDFDEKPKPNVSYEEASLALQHVIQNLNTNNTYSRMTTPIPIPLNSSPGALNLQSPSFTTPKAPPTTPVTPPTFPSSHSSFSSSSAPRSASYHQNNSLFDVLQQMDGKVIKGDQVQLFGDLYGVHPRFFSGDFNQAMNKAKTEFKLLLVYLHNERVEAVWNYCGQALCTVQLSQFIDDHFVFLGVNVDETSEQILSSAFDILAFPCFVVLANVNGANNILEIIQGPETVDDTLVRFLTIMETHGPILAKMKGENGKREGLRRLKEEQDFGFSKLSQGGQKEGGRGGEREEGD